MILSVFVKKKNWAGKKLHPKHPLVQSIRGIVLRPGRHFENFILARALKYLPTPDLIYSRLKQNYRLKKKNL